MNNTKSTYLESALFRLSFAACKVARMQMPKLAKHHILGSFAAVLMSAIASGSSEAGGPIRALAPDYVVVDRSPDPKTIPLYNPSILALPDGRLVVTNERGGQSIRQGNPEARIYTSDDKGTTWTLRGETDIGHGRLFKSGGSIYYLGHKGDLRVCRSDDNGETWSKHATLSSGQRWHQSACNVWRAKGNVYLIMERRIPMGIKGWQVGNIAPVLMRAKEGSDLTKQESWTFASELVFADIIPGYRENDLALDYFGVPFFNQSFPKTNRLVPGRGMHPIGWLESNVVQFTDPDHYWHDPEGNTFHIFMRTHTGGTGYAALAKVVENKDGSMTTSLETAPSGKKMLFLPFPGGQMRFHVCYDKQTNLYWLLGTQSTDSMTRVEKMHQDRFGIPNNERQRLVLHFSKNMVDWCFAGLVDAVAGGRESRHYASMDIDGDDLVIVSRSGDKNAKSAHDGNMITFHRVKNFRSLVY